jgi:hypothetical protein
LIGELAAVPDSVYRREVKPGSGTRLLPAFTKHRVFMASSLPVRAKTFWRGGSSIVPIRFLLEPDHVFSPDDLKNLVVAFEDTLRALNLPDRNDPLSIRVAKIIIGLAKDGERDPARLRDLALKFVRPA